MLSTPRSSRKYGARAADTHQGHAAVGKSGLQQPGRARGLRLLAARLQDVATSEASPQGRSLRGQGVLGGIAHEGRELRRGALLVELSPARILPTCSAFSRPRQEAARQEAEQNLVSLRTSAFKETLHRGQSMHVQGHHGAQAPVVLRSRTKPERGRGERG